jgi:hypothetical protein
MRLLPAVIQAEYRGDFRIHVTFNDGSENTIDFEEWLDGPMFAALKSPTYFRRFFVDGGTVVWPNGADIAPETLHEVPGRHVRSRKRVQAAKEPDRSVKRRPTRARLRT